MHLLDSFSLCSGGSKINRPYIFDKPVPLPFTKYIVIQPDARFQSRQYDYYDEVIDLIKPILDKNDIHIVTIGAEKERQLKDTYNLVGKTDIAQLAYIIKNAMCVVSVDSFSLHLAGYYDVPFVGLWSNMYPDHSRPKWGDTKKQIILTSDLKSNHPSYMAVENPKTINRITPETIASGLAKILKLSFNYPYRTLYSGLLYPQRFFELIPHHSFTVQGFGTDRVVVRLDKLHSEKVLEEQLQKSICSIVTKHPISEKLLKTYKPRIAEIIYDLDEENNPSFGRVIFQSGIKYAFVSYLSEEKVNDMRLGYMDYGIILRREPQTAEKLEIDTSKNLFFKSNKFIISNGQIFTSYACLEENHSVSSTDDTLQPLPNTPEFWADVDHHLILEKLD